MKKISKEELDKILKNHKHWLLEDIEGWENMRAYLRGTDLREADLMRADLSGTDLSGADLRGAYLSGADLREADLSGADLGGADLSGADLMRADLSGADLRGAYLSGADLREADLMRADLMRADLMRADLSGADLMRADLSGADLRGAYLSGADLREACLIKTDLSGAKYVPFIPYSCPDFGMFIGYKKASNCIVKLEIPADAKRLSATTRKCRCNKAKVLGIYDYGHNLLGITEVASNRDKNFIYKVGEVVEVKDFDEDRWNECSTGIHFFINFQEAVDY